jgi:hypothetical protein
VKWTSIILSIVFLLLSCVPCADKDGDDSTQTLVQKSISDHHNQDNDACSPFCTCGCCSSQVFAFDITTYNFDLVVIKIVENKIPEYKSILTSNFYGSIWQPPQIV